MAPVVVVTLAVETAEQAEAIAAAIGEAGALMTVDCGEPCTAIVLSARAAQADWVAEGGPGAVPG